MGAVQDVIAYGLALAIALFAIWYARRQWRVRQRLSDDLDLPPDEARLERRQCRRRLISCGLLLLIALLLVGAQLWLEAPAQHLANLRDNSDSPLTDSQRDFMRFYSAVWIAILLLLLGVVVLAAFDLWSIRRYGRIQHRKLTEDRRAMIARQLQRLREEHEND